MNENRVKRNRLLGERMVKNLESRNMEGFYAETKEELLKNKYKKQLEIYKKALEEALNRKVKKTYIYSLKLNKEIPF
ncbi:hypothetical protein [Paramuribaculum intestinale]|uniref:hypothetical protein n=1 Tax=Paramuribaculum intestinale TaxID=2094151 RepID=UPI00272C589F|nr:hypothetical protein [Paramuribaculum intestinale]